MSDTPQSEKPHTLAALAAEKAKRIREVQEHASSQLQLLFAERRIVHLRLGADEREMKMYDRLSDSIVAAVARGALKLQEELDVVRKHDVAGPHQSWEEALEALQKRLNRVGSMLRSDGFESCYAHMDAQRCDATSGPDGVLTITVTNPEMLLIEIHLEPGRTFAPPFDELPLVSAQQNP